MKYIFITLLILIILFNFYVTYNVLINDYLEKFQKLAFSAIIWLFPLLGAIGILLFIKDDERPRDPRNPNDGAGKRSMSIASQGGGS